MTVFPTHICVDWVNAWVYGPATQLGRPIKSDIVCKYNRKYDRDYVLMAKEGSVSKNAKSSIFGSGASRESTLDKSSTSRVWWSLSGL